MGIWQLRVVVKAAHPYATHHLYVRYILSETGLFMMFLLAAFVGFGQCCHILFGDIDCARIVGDAAMAAAEAAVVAAAAADDNEAAAAADAAAYGLDDDGGAAARAAACVKAAASAHQLYGGFFTSVRTLVMAFLGFAFNEVAV